MAFSRSFLKTCGLTDEQITAVMEAHTEVTDSLKQQRDGYKADADKYKADADKLPDVQKQLDDLKDGEDFKSKYENEHTAFENFKEKVKKDAETEKLKAAYRKLLTDENISEKRLDAVLKLTDFSDMKLDKDGKLENVDKLKETINSEWGEYKVVKRERGQRVENPPKDNPGSGPNTRAAELAKQYYERRYGKAPAEEGANKTE